MALGVNVSAPYHCPPELGPAQAAMEIAPQDLHDDQETLVDEDMVSLVAMVTKSCDPCMSDCHGNCDLCMSLV